MAKNGSKEATLSAMPPAAPQGGRRSPQRARMTRPRRAGHRRQSVLDRGRSGPAARRNLRRRRRGGLQDGRRGGARCRGRSSPPTSPSPSTSARPACPAEAAPRSRCASWSGASRTPCAPPAKSWAATSPSPADAEAFEAELSYMLVHQIGAFNSPVWFNCGLWHEYGIKGSGGNYAVDSASGKAYNTEDAYTRPQVSACFIQSCDDDLDSIFELVDDEARVFKYGSGSGTNFSKLRGKMEHLSGGGTSSGLMSFLEVLDKARGRHQVGRHHPARRQDGGARRRPPGDPRLHPVEGARGEEGRGADRRRLLLGLQRRRLPHRVRPEREQLGARDGPVHRGGAARTRSGRPPPAPRATWSSASRRASCGARWRKRRGSAPIPGCSSTTRSTSGTPARRPTGSTRRTRAASSSSSTTPPATSPS